MSSAIKSAYGTSNQTVTITVASLTTGSFRESTVIDNSSNLFLDALVSLKLKSGASGTASTGYVNIWAYGTADGGTTYSDGCTGSDAALTPTVPPNLRLLGTVNLVANATTYKGGPFSVAQAFGGVLPDHWGLVVENQTSGTLDATGGSHAVVYQGVYANVGVTMGIAVYVRPKQPRPPFAAVVDTRDPAAAFPGLQLAYACSEGAGATSLHNVTRAPWTATSLLALQNTPTWTTGPDPLGTCFHTTKDTNQRAYFNTGAVAGTPVSAPAQFTLSCWFRLVASVTSGNNAVFGVNVTNTSTSPFEFYTLFVSRATGQAWLVHGIGSSETILDSNKAVNDGRPHHLAATWDGATARVFVDGRQRNSAATSGVVGSSAADVCIGAQQGQSNAPTGDYAHCLLWNRALPPALIGRLYEQPGCYLQPRRARLASDVPAVVVASRFRRTLAGRTGSRGGT